MAHIKQLEGAIEHHHHSAAVPLARTQSGREHLTVSAPELALKPSL